MAEALNSPKVSLDELVEEHTLLANVPDDEMYRLLDLAGPEQAGEVRQFLAEPPEIRSRRLAFTAASRSQTHLAWPRPCWQPTAA